MLKNIFPAKLVVYLAQFAQNIVAHDNLLSVISICNVYAHTFVRRVRVNATTEITVKGIQGFIKRTVIKFGSGAKVDCPKEYLGRNAYLIIMRDKE